MEQLPTLELVFHLTHPATRRPSARSTDLPSVPVLPLHVPPPSALAPHLARSADLLPHRVWDVGLPPRGHLRGTGTVGLPYVAQLSGPTALAWCTPVKPLRKTTEPRAAQAGAASALLSLIAMQWVQVARGEDGWVTLAKRCWRTA
jgi:hypothetical protein